MQAHSFVDAGVEVRQLLSQGVSNREGDCPVRDRCIDFGGEFRIGRGVAEEVVEDAVYGDGSRVRAGEAENGISNVD